MDLMITTNYAQTNYANFKNKNNQVQFKGELGEQLLKRGIKELSAETCTNAAKGRFGLNTEKVTDILGSLIQFCKNLTTKLAEKTSELNVAQRLINTFPQEKAQAVREAESTLYQRIQDINTKHQQEMTELRLSKDAAIAQLKKYEGMAKVKSVEEVGCLMPNRVMEIIDEAVAMRRKAHVSMESFLFEGKDQEDAIAYLNKMAELHKAQQDGLFNIKEISDKKESRTKAATWMYGSHPVQVALDMINEVMTTSDRAQWLKAPKIRAQVNTNAINLLEMLCSKEHWKEQACLIQRTLNEILSNNVDYKINYRKGLEQLKKNDEIASIEERILPYNLRDSYITGTYKDGTTDKVTASYVANLGKNNRS